MNSKTIDQCSSKLTLSWLDYNTNRDKIQKLRYEVFVEEQGLGGFVLDSPSDARALHLGLFDGKDLVSCVTVYPYKYDHEFVQTTEGLDFKQPYSLQFSRRVELNGYRSRGLSALMLAHAMRSSYEFFQPDCIFAILLGPHKKMKHFYISTYRFNRCQEYSNEHGEGFLLVMDKQNIIDQVASQLKAHSINLSEKMKIQLPDLTYHISQNKILEDYLRLQGDQVNRYLNPLSLHDELPRLSAQARMLFRSQKGIWKTLLNGHDNHQTIIDIGCGPGVYMSQLSKLNTASGRKLIGMDISQELITYARFSHPDLEWKEGSVYDTKLDSESIDVVHCSFLFIHLINPFLALKEIYRILTPGGLFYISDVNDGTFQGPQKIIDLIDAHNEIYEGNRKIMSSIHHLTEKVGFEHVKSDHLMVDNSGSDQNAELDGRYYKLGKLSMWGMFSFLGQRDEVKEQFEEADQHYFDSNCTISIEVQSRIFKKVN